MMLVSWKRVRIAREGSAAGAISEDVNTDQAYDGRDTIAINFQIFEVLYWNFILNLI